MNMNSVTLLYVTVCFGVGFVLFAMSELLLKVYHVIETLLVDSHLLIDTDDMNMV